MLPSRLADPSAIRALDLPAQLNRLGVDHFDELVAARIDIRMIRNVAVQYRSCEVDQTPSQINAYKTDAVQTIAATFTEEQQTLLAAFGLKQRQRDRLRDGELPSCLKAYVVHRLEWGGEIRKLRVAIVPSYLRDALRARALEVLEGILRRPVDEMAAADRAYCDAGYNPRPIPVLLPAPRPLELTKYDAGLRVLHMAMEEAAAAAARTSPQPHRPPVDKREPHHAARDARPARRPR